MAATTTRNPHIESLATSTAIASWYVKNMIRPQEVMRILNDAKVRFMLAGAHGIAGWRRQ